jgi:glycosyltransferase involved in cell wall biosynthesis
MYLIIQIPCYNEEKTLSQVIANLPLFLPGITRLEILVVDDGSIDNTVALARQLGVQHIIQPYSKPGAGGCLSDWPGSLLAVGR